MSQWEILEEMTEVDSGAAFRPGDDRPLAEVEVEDLHLVADAVLTEVEIEVTDQCSKPHAATVEKIAKFLLDQQTENLSTAVNVLKKWVMAEEVTPQDKKEMISDHPLQFQTKIMSNLMRLMPN